MKPVTDFALENADWLALLVDDSGVVRHANGAARKDFGAILEGTAPFLTSLWSAESGVSCAEFLNRVERSGAASGLLKFQVNKGAIVSYQSCVCSQLRNGQRFFIIQLFREKPAETPSGSAPATTEANRPAVDASLAHKQKLDCALQLTRTVAADFNNALTSILGHTSLVLGKMEANHPWRNSLLQVEKSAEKAAEIAHDLAGFSRQEKDTQYQVVGNLNHLLRRTVELFQTPSSGRIGWSLQLESQLYGVVFDEAKIQQALMKILDNATQAAGSTGQITVSSRNLHAAEPRRDATVTLTRGDYVCIEISDTGGGIPAEVLPRIFEPFFTTKAGHRGLGLAWVYGIVTNHGGSVAVSSQLGQGTSVRVYLPAVKKIVRDTSVPDDHLGGNQTILLVDDEAILVTMGEMILSEFGYRVLTASSGQKALEIFKQAETAIDLVITDLVMPDMSGRELMEHLRRLSPAVRIICASGFMQQTNPSEDEEWYLQKPFTSQELLRKVKQVLA